MFFYIFNYTHYTLRLIRYSFTCNVISICVEQCIFKQLFPNVYYITATKQHNAAHYRHKPGDEHRMRYLDNPRLPVHA